MTETIMYQLESTPDLMVGVTPNATIVLQLTEVKQRIAIPNPAELQQVIEQAMATQRNIARVMYPSGLRQQIITALQDGPRSFAYLLTTVPPGSNEDLRRELRRMTSDGQLTLQPPSGADGLVKYRLVM